AMPLPMAVPLFSGVLDAIGHAHRQGIIHRDIKPSNVMVLPDGTPKVMDFGIARALGSSHQTRVGAIVGTLEYMSPEQIQGKETDARSDIYSLGILLYEMLTGRVPFAADSEYALLQAHIQASPPPPRVFTPDIPEIVAQVVLRALEKDPNRRFQTAGEFKLALVAATTPSLAAIPSDVRVALSLSGTSNGLTSPICPPPSPSPAASKMLPPFHQTALPPSPVVATKSSDVWLKVIAWSLAGVAALVFVLATLAYVWVHRGGAVPESRTPAASQPPSHEEAISLPPATNTALPPPERDPLEVPPPSRSDPPGVLIPDVLPPRSGGVISPEPPSTSEEVAPKKQPPKRTGKDQSGVSERERRRRKALEALDQ
ncbi:MAG: protein kinase, partial [Chloracidobacterium sp.]